MTTLLQSIESDDLTVGQLFRDFYTVPDYQREYVWEESNVEQLVHDINNEFDPSDSEASEYFIGSVVVLKNEDGTFELIDGQQRITTLFLLLCAIRDHLAEVGSEAITTLGQQIAATSIDEKGSDVFRYRVDLQYADSGKVLVRIAEGQEDLLSLEGDTRSIRNILSAYTICRRFLRSEFGGKPAVVRAFYAYLTLHVKLIRVETSSIAHALKVFETINDRGVGLDSMDLLKNLMFMNASAGAFDHLRDIWKALVDLLHQSSEKPLRFLRYFVLASYDVDRLREDEIYTWFQKNDQRCGYDDDPVGFSDRLHTAAQAFVAFGKGQGLGGKRNRYLDNLRYLSGAARQHLILLLAARGLPENSFERLCEEVENLFFAYLVSREPTRQFETRFARWADDLREVEGPEDLQNFLGKYFNPEKEDLARRFRLALLHLDQDSIQKYRMRYILGKLTQHIDEAAHGSHGPERDLATYVNRQVEVEHILPQTPGPKNEIDPEQYRQLVGKLGNLTLLERPINASISNQDFEYKRQKYAESKFLLTRTIGKEVKIGSNTSIDRAVSELRAFDRWGEDEVKRRQEIMTNLASRVWGVPRVEIEPEELVAFQ